MFTSALSLLLALARSTIALSLSAAAAWLLLRWFNPESPRLSRIVWMLVLLQGIILLRIPLAVPCYTAESNGAATQFNGSIIQHPDGRQQNSEVNLQPAIANDVLKAPSVLAGHRLSPAFGLQAAWQF